MLEQFFNENILLRLINGALQLDPQAAEKLAPLSGKRIAITVQPRDTAWIFRVDSGRLHLDDVAVRDCEVRLSGTLGGFLRLFKNGKEEYQGGSADERLYIEGDLHAAQTFQRVMGTLSPDLGPVLRERFGERLGGRLAEAAEQLRRFGEAGRERAEDSLRAWLQESFVARHEFVRQSQTLADLKARMDGLESMLNRLEKS